MVDKLLIVSGDSHAAIPREAWSHYLEQKYHWVLPEVESDEDFFLALRGGYQDYSPEVLEFLDVDDSYASGGTNGVWELDRRMVEMDREGVAAEFVYLGDQRVIPFLDSPANRVHEPDVRAAGARAYHRWLVDVFGRATDRLLLVADAGPCTDMAETLAELEWTRDQGFAGTFAPGFVGHPDLPPLYDEYFDPFWDFCQANGMTVVIHAGHGSEQGKFIEAFRRIREQMEAAGRTDLQAEITNTGGFFSLDIKPRRAMWQMMLGGVFDRFPALRLLITEVRGDWLPATLKHLDEAFARSDVAAVHSPSTYWQRNCLVSLSFVHRAEVAMRHEIGLESITFGRDYPHSEGTWPNTREWLNDAFHAVPADELRLMLGENAVRQLGLDRQRLLEVASRVGPTVEEIIGTAPDVDPRRLAHYDARGGYLKPPEDVDLDAVDEALAVDLVGTAARHD